MWFSNHENALFINYSYVKEIQKKMKKDSIFFLIVGIVKNEVMCVFLKKKK
jgi:hypothetical protein